MKEFSSPIGESIFSTENYLSEEVTGFVLVPYRGIYFLYQNSASETRKLDYSSRPLSGNLFSLPELETIIKKTFSLVLVPYRGIYFLYETCLHGYRPCKVLVPYRGIYFLYKEQPNGNVCEHVVLVPYRGIYFLYWRSR